MRGMLQCALDSFMYKNYKTIPFEGTIQLNNATVLI